MSTKQIPQPVESTETEMEPVAEETEPEVSIQNAESLISAIDEMAENMDVDDYTGQVSNVNHGHDLDKHDVRSSFGVNDDFVADHFVTEPNDHAAVWELSYRKDEFVSMDDSLFTGKSDTDSRTWDSIESRKTSAPIPDETHRKLRSL